MKKITCKTRSLMFFVILLTIFLSSCKKIDNSIDYLFDFEGVFRNPTGWELTLDKSMGEARYTKAGTPEIGTAIGDVVLQNMKRINDDTWSGSVKDGNGFGFLRAGTVTISTDMIKMKPDDRAEYYFTKISNGSGGTSSTGIQTIVSQYIDGNQSDKKIVSFQVPSNVKKLTVQTSEDATAYRNTADIGVRQGSPPTVSGVNWIADCYGIKPNREPESCIINNPSSGTWYALLYGYNTYFSSKLTISISY